MTDEQKKNFVGKYVCYDTVDGGSCWGRIKEVVRVNTMKGEVDAFILSDRYNRYQRNYDLKRFRKFFPDSDPSATPTTGEMGNDGKWVKDPDMFMEIRKYKGDTILHVASINLERDVVDAADLMGKVDTDTLFQTFLDGRGHGENGRTALEIGMFHLMGDEAMRLLGKVELGKRV